MIRREEPLLSGEVSKSDPSPSSPLETGDLFAEMYQQLRALAVHQIQGERGDHTLQATALLHEAFLRLAPQRRVPWRDRGHLVAATAEAMRHVLLDHAKARRRLKRGGPVRATRIPLDLVDLAETGDAEMILALDAALQELEQEAPDAAAVVKLRFYACQTVPQTAVALGVSPRSVDRAWAYGRAWLFRALQAREGDA